jgi:hypothetical protein
MLGLDRFSFDLSKQQKFKQAVAGSLVGVQASDIEISGIDATKARGVNVGFTLSTAGSGSTVSKAMGAATFTTVLEAQVCFGPTLTSS